MVMFFGIALFAGLFWVLTKGLNSNDIESINRMGPDSQKVKLGDKIQLMGAISAPNDIWFVDGTNGADTNDDGRGGSWDKSFKTVIHALTRASAWDWIYIAPGDYDEGAVIDIATEGIKLIGPGIGNQHNAMLYSTAASHHIITISANNVEICGLGITQTKDTYSGIMIATTAARYKCYIHHCRFDGYGAGEYGINTGTTYDSPDVTVHNNVFRSWQTAALHCNATRGEYIGNRIYTVAGKIGIEYVPNAGDRPGSMITDNYILGVNSTDTGIQITNTPNAGSMMIAKNYLPGCATTITQAANNAYNTVNNYTSSGAGGVLIDTVA